MRVRLGKYLRSPRRMGEKPSTLKLRLDTKDAMSTIAEVDRGLRELKSRTDEGSDERQEAKVQ